MEMSVTGGPHDGKVITVPNPKEPKPAIQLPLEPEELLNPVPPEGKVPKYSPKVASYLLTYVSGPNGEAELIYRHESLTHEQACEYLRPKWEGHLVDQTYPRTSDDWRGGEPMLEVIRANGCRARYERRLVLGVEELKPRGQAALVTAFGAVATRHTYDELCATLDGHTNED